MKVAVFRPDDDRLREAERLLESLGATPVLDPMLAVEPTGRSPRRDGAFVVFTSPTGADVAREHDWDPGEATVVAIGPRTASQLREHGYTVDIVPAEYSSSGLVGTLADVVAGERVEVARSDHGSPVLTDGLDAAGAYVHETILYRLVRPGGAGDSAELAAAGHLDAALFTSSLTVEHFLGAAEDRGIRQAAIDGLENAVVGAIGDPTRATASGLGITVDVVPERATFEALARAVLVH